MLDSPRASADDDILRSQSLRATRSLFQYAPRWIHRSVNKYHYVDIVTLRGTTSIDFTVPPFGPNSIGDSESQLLYVPLAFVPDQKLASVDLRDERQQSIPALNRDSERELTAAMLLSAWSDLLKTPVEELTEIARETKTLLAPDGNATARNAVENLEKIARDERIADRAEGQWLLSQSRLFLGGSIIYGVLQDAHPGQRRILKISYLTSAPINASFRIVGERLGLLATQLLLPDLPAASCRSYHLEFAAPEGMRFRSALLDVAAPRINTLDRLEDCATSLAHLYVSNHASNSDPPAVYARLTMRADNGPWLRYAFLIALIGTGLIWLTSTLLDSIHVYSAGGLVGAALVALTGIPPLFLARPSIHPISAQLLAGVRFALVLLSLLAIVVAWALLTNPSLSAGGVHMANIDLFAWRWRISAAMSAITAYIGANFLPWLWGPFRKRLDRLGQRWKQWRERRRLQRASAVGAVRPVDRR